MSRLVRDRAGNTLALIAAGLVPLLALVGGGIDMGRSYLAESRLQQACDAGVLAARKRMGSSAAVDGEVPDEVNELGKRFFDINFGDGAYSTEHRDFEMTLEPDYSITGEAAVEVPVTIMALFGYDRIPITVSCEAQLSMPNLDVMMVLDVTGSMAEANPSDSEPKIAIMNDVIRGFHARLEGSKAAGSRIRYGFVPYSTNVNVGGLLHDDWVVGNWSYQSRTLIGKGTANGTYSFYTAMSPVSGTKGSVIDSTYAAQLTGNGYKCSNPPSNAIVSDWQLQGTTSEPFAGPPAGTRKIDRYRVLYNGTEYTVQLSGSTCTVIKSTYANYIWTVDYITQPALVSSDVWNYGPVAKDVSNWRNETPGCIEERNTYEIADYDDIDFSRALDLNIDLVPTAGNPASQWRPMYGDLIFGRAKTWRGNGKFDPAPIATNKEFIQPHGLRTDSCPPAASKLAEMSSGQLDSYLGTLTPWGSTYHDIGMIWGARLLSPTGLFAAENANVGGTTTSRHLIFMTDGQTSALDVAYSSYGFEPVDRRRWSPSSALNLTETVEKRFNVACQEARKRNITVWVIAFGTQLNTLLEDCAGPGRAFQADDAEELEDTFDSIANQVGDLRITK